MRAFVSLLLLALLASSAFAITLVKDGKPAAAIVIADTAFKAKPYTRSIHAVGKPNEKIRAAAEDLQAYIEKISGAKVPIVSDTAPTDQKGGALILVGASALTKDLRLKIPAGVTKDFVEEGYVMFADNNHLVLAGNNDENYHGTEYAVFQFLYNLGARWYMPGAYGEYLPSMTTITVPAMNITARPDFIERSWWQNANLEMQMQDAEFKIRNRMNTASVLPGAGDSSIRNWLPDPSNVKTHPEYYGKNADGTINETMLNLTNPDVPKLVAEKMKADIKKQLAAGIAIPSVPIAPDDGMPIDYSKETMKKNVGFTDLCGRQGVPTEVSVTEEWIDFVNKVAEEVTKDYPNALIGTNGYANRNQAPEGVKLHPNLAIEFAAIWSDVLHTLDNPKSWQTNVKLEMMRRWCAQNKRVYIYDYDMQMLVTAVTPVPGAYRLAKNFPLMKEAGLAGFYDEARNAYMEEGVHTKYLRSRMMWDTKLDVNATLDDFYSHWYGAAAKPARAFWDDLEQTMEATVMQGHEDRVLPFVYTPELLKRLDADIAQAEKLANDDRSKEHVRIDRLILSHLQAYMAMHDDEFDGNYARAAKQADLMWACRLSLEKINPFFVRTKGEYTFLNSGELYWGVQARMKHYRELNDMLTGKTGKLVAMAPREVKFALDPADLGHLESWFDAGYDRSKWQTIDTCKPFYLQTKGGLDARGIPYQGYMWYVFEIKAPENVKGQPVHVYTPIVVDDAWAWVNGEYVGHRGHLEPYYRPAPMDFDVTKQLKPGRTNVIAVRVTTGYCPAAVADGFMGRLFLYSPVAQPAAK